MLVTTLVLYIAFVCFGLLFAWKVAMRILRSKVPRVAKVVYEDNDGSQSFDGGTQNTIEKLVAFSEKLREQKEFKGKQNLLVFKCDKGTFVLTDF